MRLRTLNHDIWMMREVDAVGRSKLLRVAEFRFGIGDGCYLVVKEWW